MDELEEMLTNLFKSLGFKNITMTTPGSPDTPPEEELVPVVHIIPIAAFPIGGPMRPPNFVNPNFRQMQAKMNMRGVIRDVDITEFEDTVIVTLDVPGVELKDVNIDLTDQNTLKISARQFTGERENISVRAMFLPVPVVMDKPEVTLNHGVLEIRMRRAPTAPPTPT